MCPFRLIGPAHVDRTGQAVLTERQTPGDRHGRLRVGAAIASPARPSLRIPRPSDPAGPAPLSLHRTRGDARVRPERRTGDGMYSLLNLIDTILGLYKWCLIIYVILSWLISFNVLNTYNRLVFMANDFLYKITEPALRPIRKVIPALGGIDVSPVILILIIHFVQNLLREYGM